MNAFHIHEDQENLVPEIRQKRSNMAVQQKRCVLGVIDNNKPVLSERGPKGKQPLAALNANVNSNIANEKSSIDKENCKNLVNPIVPVAQFEAFKVYEDSSYEEKIARINERLKLKSTSQVYKGTAEDRFYTKREVAELEKKRKEEQIASGKYVIEDKPCATDSDIPLSPMCFDQSFDDSLQLAEDVVLKSSKNTKDIFFEMEEYRKDIYQYLREHEVRHRPKAGYMKKQPDVTSNMRTILVDWLVEVAEEYKLQTETLYLSVNYIDRFLSYMSVVRAKLQLVGTAAMFLASKYEEIFPPEIVEFVYITDDTYNKRQVIRMEHLILKVLNFDLSVPTPLTFITAMCISNKLTEKTMYLAMYLSELALLNDLYLELLPSMIAASAIALARHTLGDEAWSDQLMETTGYELKHLQSSIEFLHSTFRMAPTHPQHAIQDKYKSQKYMHVSKLDPRDISTLFS